MNFDELVDIVKTGEGYTIELKESLGGSVGKDICAFANSSGGKIIIGVDDKTGEVKCYKLTNSDKSRIQNIARNMSPAFNIQVEQVEKLAVIYVPEGKDKPYAINGHFYLRYGANSQQLNRDEIRDLFQRENIISFERKVPEFDRNDFSEEAFENFRKEAGLDSDLPREHILRNLNLLTENKLNNCGVLFFARHTKQYFPNATISCFLYADEEQTEIIDSKEFSSDIISNMNDAYKYLLSKLNTAIIIDGLKHIPKLELPKNALREAIINAMIHRDYFFPANIQIHISPQRAVIVNPGKLMFPKEDLGKISAQRNPILVDLIHRLGLVEKAGSGIKRMKKSMKEYGLELSFETSSFFSAIFYRNIRSQSDADPTQIRRKSDANSRLEWILSYLKEKDRIKMRDIKNHFSIHRDTAVNDLNKLIDQNKIVKCGGGNNVWYELKEKDA
jgi:ATP-dependent DNA helicase RecG